MDLKIGFLFRFSFDKDIHYCLGSIKKIHWYKIKKFTALNIHVYKEAGINFLN